MVVGCDLGARRSHGCLGSSGWLSQGVKLLGSGASSSREVAVAVRGSLDGKAGQDGMGHGLARFWRMKCKDEDLCRNKKKKGEDKIRLRVGEKIVRWREVEV